MGFRIVFFIASFMFAMVPGIVAVHAEKRIALVIGNSDYRSVAFLPNPRRDAKAVADTLREIGFDEVKLEMDLGRDAMVRALRVFREEADKADWAMIYFAGHGIEINRVNYLVPTDARLLDDRDVTTETVSYEELLATVGGAKALRLIVLDACRNNPFKDRMRRMAVVRTATDRGLAPPPETDAGTLVVYSARDGDVAADDVGDANSPFALAFMAEMKVPGREVRRMFDYVRDDVLEATNKRQQPFTYGSLPGRKDFYFVAATQVAVVTPVQKLPPADPCRGAVTVSFASQCAAPLTAAQERGLQPKDSFRECEQCPEMVVVPRGSFTMGSPENEPGRDKERDKDESPQHVVTIERAFAVGRLHVTVDQFATFVTETGHDAGSKCWTFQDGKLEWSNRSWRNPGFAQDDSHPVVCVSWDDAKAYVDWLTQRTGKPYRLLTEAEFEYAAGARTVPGAYPRFWFGNDERVLCRYGNGRDQKARDTIEGAKGWKVLCNDGYAYTSPAGHFEANDFGLHDMFGNAWQWTEDCYHDSYTGAPPDGGAWTTGDCGRRVNRGGSWLNDPAFLRAARRQPLSTGNRNYFLGFRVGRTLAP